MQRDSHASCRTIANDLDPGFNAEFDEDNDRLPPDKHEIAGLTTHRQHTSISAMTHTDTEQADKTPAELDSHADTCSFGHNAYIVHETGETITVSGFIDELGTVKQVPIVTAAVAYDDPATLQTYVLFFHQSLYFKGLHKHLQCPSQMRENQITVNEVPLLHLPFQDRTHSSHSIISEPPHQPLHIPLSLNGTTSYFITRMPTQAEIESDLDCIHVHMTSDQPWNPDDPTVGDTEDKLRQALDLMPRERGDRAVSLLSTVRGERSQIQVLEARSASTVAALRIQPSLPFEIDIEASASVKASSVLPLSKKGKVSPEELAVRWQIGLDTAKKTLDATTQLAIRDFSTTTGGRRLKPYTYQLKYPRLNVEMYTDTLIGRCKSLLGNTVAQVYATPFHWVAVEPMKSKSEAHYSLDNLFRKVGVPRVIIPDNAKELTEGMFKKKALRVGAAIHPIEAHTPNANIAEHVIRELKRSYRRVMLAKNAPECLWDLCLQHVATLRSHTALSIRDLDGEVPAARLTGDTPDISHLVEFGWYDWVWFLSPEDVRMERRSLGRYVGHSSDIGDAICARILTEKGKFVSRTSVFPLTSEETRSDTIRDRQKQFEESLKKALGNRFALAKDVLSDEEEETPVLMDYEPVEEGDPTPELAQEADEVQHEAFDKYISSRVCIPQGDSMVYGTVKRRKRDQDGELIGRSNKNPLLDTSVYEVEFDTGDTEAYHANIIAESIYSQVDGDGYTTFAMKEIIDHRTDESAVKMDDAYIVHHQTGKKRLKRTTQGWQLCVKWNDESTTWVPLKDLKESNPVEVAEYAVNMKLVSEPAFAWWVPFTIKKRDRIIKAVKKRYFRVFQKYGIELPKTVKRALEIDSENGTTHWRDAIRKEMAAVGKAFEILDEGASAPVGHTLIDAHMVFDIKPDFTRKARLVAGGHMTDPPASITYASVVSRESVRIAFLIAALNDLDVLAADIGNAYLNARTKEKVYIICGKEFGDEYVGRKAVIVRALYGLKSSGAAWRSCLAEVLRDQLGFQPCRADNDVWLRPSQKPDGSRYYEYVLVYTDDILCVSCDPKAILCRLDQHFMLKAGSIGPPTQYLGASVGKWKFENGEQCWYMGSDQYVAEAIRNVSSWLEGRGQALKSKVAAVLPSNYRPELDVSPLCNAEDHSTYMQHIGILRWAVELGRIDIATEVSMMAAYAAAPRQYHLMALMHIYAWLKSHNRSKVVLDPSYVEHAEPEKLDWEQFYPGASELLPPDMPEPLGKPIQMTTFVDSDHAGDKVTRRSRTGVLVFLNRAPIIWFTKKQNSIETSSFGSEFTAMKQGVEISEGLRYKLRMMGVPLDGATHIKADNMSVIKNTSLPESMLKKKSNSIAYHYVRERAASGAVSITYEPTESNLADMLTKSQPGPTRKNLVHRVLF